MFNTKTNEKTETVSPTVEKPLAEKIEVTEPTPEVVPVADQMQHKAQEVTEQEKLLAALGQALLDADSDYTGLLAKVKKKKKDIEELDAQRASYLEKIQTDKVTLKKYEAEVMEAEPSELDALKVKMDGIAHQVLANENWLRLNHKDRSDRDRVTLKKLEKERFQKFYAIITSLRGQQTAKAIACLKQAVSYHRLWGEALNKLRNDNQVQGSGSDDVYLMNNAYDLGLDFTGPPMVGTGGVERFEFDTLIRRYG